MSWYKQYKISMAIPEDLSDDEKEWIKKRYLYEHDIYTFRIMQKVIEKLNNYFDFNMSVPLGTQPKRRPLYDRLGLGPLNPNLFKEKVEEKPYIEVGPRGRRNVDDGGDWMGPENKQQLIKLLAHEAAHSWTHSHGNPMRVTENALIPTVEKLWNQTMQDLNLKEEKGIYVPISSI